MSKNIGKILFLLVLCAALVFVISLRARNAEKPEPAAASPQPVSEPEPPRGEGPDKYGAVELTGIMTPSEIAELDKYEKLQRVDLSGSTCYEEIMQYSASHPQVEVIYTVAAGGTEYPSKAETVSVSTAEELKEFVSVAGFFQSVDRLEIKCEDFSAADLDLVKQAIPDAVLDYSVTLNGEKLSGSAKSADLSSLTSDGVEAAAEKLTVLPELESIELMKPDGTSNFTPEDLSVLQNAAPQACLNYSFELFGKTVSTSDTRLEFVDRNDIGNAGLEKLRSVLPFMTKLEYLKLDDCGTDDKAMASLRDDFPNVKIVWRVYFSAYGERMDGTMGVYSCLTDTEKVWATGCVHDQQAEALKYCTDVKYLDLGHNCITTIDFVNYMPNLEVAILAISWVEDLSPLANCPKLEYLEAFSLGDENLKTIDISPLAACTNLKHLNLSNIPRYASPKLCDISPLYDLDLERFYCVMNEVPEDQQAKFKELHPDCETQFGMIDPTKTVWRYTDGFTEDSPKADKMAHRTERYALLCEQIGYDTFDYSKK